MKRLHGAKKVGNHYSHNGLG